MLLPLSFGFLIRGLLTKRNKSYAKPFWIQAYNQVSGLRYGTAGHISDATRGKCKDKRDLEHLYCYSCFIIIVHMKFQNWLLLTYKVPPEPAKKRIALWRKLKGMGAIYLQNGVCLLPKTDDHTRRLKILENEINEMAGESVILETVALDQAQEGKVVARFKADRDEQYEEFLDKCKDYEGEIAKETAVNHFTYAELEENDVDLKKLQNWLEKISKLSSFRFSQQIGDHDCDHNSKACRAHDPERHFQ
jgi:hypothetical protein